VERPFSKLARRISSYLAGPSFVIEPRKGAEPLGSPRSYRQQDVTDGKLIREHSTRLPFLAYSKLANDDIIFAIRQTLKRAIGGMEYKIVPDTARIKLDFKRWQKWIELKIALPGLEMDFQPQAMPLEFFQQAHGELVRIVSEELAQAGPDGLAHNTRLRDFFGNCEEYFNVVAEGHIDTVSRVFERPSSRDMSSFRMVIDRIVDDLTLWDASAIVKVPLADGTGLGEFYTIPGQEVRLYRCDDRSQPAPPNIAYDWSANDQIRALYNNLELTYIMANTQADGYGKSPIEVLTEQIMASMFGDGYILDFFANNNMPRGVFDLGPNVDEPERKAVENRWNQQVQKGLRRVIFVSNHDNVRGWVPIPADSNKDTDIIALQQHWANRKCAAYNLSLNDIGFTQDLHRTTSDTQAELTESRGINSMAKIISEYLQNEIVRGFMWVRDDPESPSSLAGRAVPIFPFRDVKFEFVLGDREDKDDITGEISLLRNGVLSINEERKERDLPPIAGGDKHVVWDSGGGPMLVENLGEIPGPQEQQAIAPQPGGSPDALAPPGQPRALPAAHDEDRVEKRLTDLAHKLKNILDE
jgi:hypothetical protein